MKELYKKGLNDLDNHDGVVTHILECNVKWALGSISMNKAGGGDGIPIELFQILKDDDVKMLHSTCQRIKKKTHQKIHFHSNPKQGKCQRIFKLVYSCVHFTC